jgi:hypothetical protein
MRKNGSAPGFALWGALTACVLAAAYFTIIAWNPKAPSPNAYGVTWSYGPDRREVTRQSPAAAETLAAAPVYRGTPEILKMAHWKGGPPDDAEIIRRATDPGVMRYAEDDPLDYGISYHASGRASKSGGRMPPVEDDPGVSPRGESVPAPRKKCSKCPNFPAEQTLDGHPIDLPEFVFPVADKAMRAAVRLMKEKADGLKVSRVEFTNVTEGNSRADQDERSYSGTARLYDENGDPHKGWVVWSISVARKKAVWSADDESFVTSQGIKPNRVEYPADKGPRPAPPRGPAKPD